MSDQNRRVAFLNEMGLGPVWSQRNTVALLALDDVPAAVLPSVVASAGIDKKLRIAEPPSSAWADVLPTKRDASSPVMSKVNIPIVIAEVAQMGWDQLKTVVSTCIQCDLCKTRTQTVFGDGDKTARWLFVGEGPGRNEDFQGLPFVGPAGKLLDNMFVAMGLKRGENTYITNVVKCRSADANKHDRRPVAEEANACMPYLERQIALINPTVIIALGKAAALSLLKLDPSTSVSELRGTVHRHANKPVIVTYHPAYLLRSPTDKNKAWADLCLAMQTYADSADV